MRSLEVARSTAHKELHKSGDVYKEGVCVEREKSCHFHLFLTENSKLVTYHVGNFLENFFFPIFSDFFYHS